MAPPTLPPLPTVDEILQNMRQMSLASFRQRLSTLQLYAEGNASDREFYLKLYNLLQNSNNQNKPTPTKK